MPPNEMQFGFPVEIRDLERREVFGRVIPYGETIIIRGRPERFVRGALAGINPEDVRLLAHHDQQRPIGRVLTLEERDDGAYASFKISRTPLGDEMLELAADGVLMFSPGFLPGEQSTDGTHRRLRSLPEISLVTFGAYPGARVLAVREGEPMPPEVTTTPTAHQMEVEVIPAVLEVREDEGIGRIETRVTELGATLERIASIVDAPRLEVRAGAIAGLTPLDWFRAQLDAAAGRYERREQMEQDWTRFQTRVASGELELRLLADITGAFPAPDPATDLSDLVIEEFIGSQLVNVLDSRRRIASRLGSFPMPRSGYAKIPVVTQHTLVDTRSGQKDPANSRKMIVTTQPFEAVWYDGAVDIALEIIRTAEIGVVDMVWNDLLGQYAIVTEAGVVAAIEAGGLGFTYTGDALDLTSYATFAADVATQALEVEEGSGAPATLLAVTKTQWPQIVAMVNADDRRNDPNTLGFNATSITLPGGVQVFYGGTGLTQAFITNPESLRFADGGPERVEATNVELMGRDLGLLGRTMFVPRIPAGVIVFGDDPES